jgi:hypothetical protein
MIRPLLLALALTAPARAAVSTVDAPGVEAAKPAHPNPRLKLSYRRFSIANLDGTPLWLDGAELDVYPLSRRWVRAGFELEGGGAHASLDGNGASLGYGLLGASVGVQYPWRVTPFVEGRFAGGVLGGSLDQPITVGGVSVSGSSVATWMYGGGLDVGVEIYTVRRFYVSTAVGWIRTTWHGADLAAMQADPAGGVQTRDLTSDSFTFKIGCGI